METENGGHFSHDMSDPVSRFVQWKVRNSSKLYKIKIKVDTSLIRIIRKHSI